MCWVWREIKNILPLKLLKNISPEYKLTLFFVLLRI